MDASVGADFFLVSEVFVVLGGVLVRLFGFGCLIFESGLDDGAGTFSSLSAFGYVMAGSGSAGVALSGGIVMADLAGT